LLPSNKPFKKPPPHPQLLLSLFPHRNNSAKTISIIMPSSSHKQSKKFPFKRSTSLRFICKIFYDYKILYNYSVKRTINNKKKNNKVQESSSPKMSHPSNNTTKSRKNISKHSQEQSFKKLHI